MSMCVLMRSIVPNAASNYVCGDSKQLAAGNVGDRSWRAAFDSISHVFNPSRDPPLSHHHALRRRG